MAPLVAALHGNKNFTDLADFLIGGHFSIGHATGFGKLVDEKILPNVFGTIKLDKKNRRGNIFEEPCFDNIDHVVHRRNGDALLSLKASKWTIQLGQAVELNSSFNTIRTLLNDGHHHYQEIVMGVFYGTEDRLTDKYRLVRGISTGANHDVYDLRNYVKVLAGQRFWAWLGENEETQQWVMQGILNAINENQHQLNESQDLMEEYKNSFVRRYSHHIAKNGTVDWSSVLRGING